MLELYPLLLVLDGFRDDLSRLFLLSFWFFNILLCLGITLGLACC